MINTIETQRRLMVERQLQHRGIGDQKVLDAMARVPREKFVSFEEREKSYHDGPLPIGGGQTISQPYIVAYMTELLQLQGGERVLEIGTGCGFVFRVGWSHISFRKSHNLWSYRSIWPGTPI